MRSVMTLFLMTMTLVLGACERSGEDTKEAALPDATPDSVVWSRLAPDELSEAQRQQLQSATQARDAMAVTLKGELMSAIQSGGPVHAIDICQTRAPLIAQEVGDRLGVEIGRTSHKLRNPSNTGPEWMRSVEDADATGPIAFADPVGDELGVAYPILLENACVICHGSDEQIAPAVREALAQRYPNDHATGFAPGDLRGWFWVQVPAID